MRKLPKQSADRTAPDARRRGFLRAASGAGALGALAVLAAEGEAAAAPVAPAVPATPVTSGYRETEHIRTYYRTAKYW